MTEPPKKRLTRRPGAGPTRIAPVELKLTSRKARSASSRAWLERQLADPFAAAARAAGYRSRAALKLAEVDDRYHIIPRGGRVIDLGCAPGGWLQVAVQRGAGVVAGVDLLHVEPAPGALLLRADFTSEGVGDQLITLLGGPPDLVLSDMAPNTTGHRRTDHLRIMNLIELASEFAARTLRPGGDLFVKAFQGGGAEALAAALRADFTDVRHIKPAASRPESSELYLLARGRRDA